MNLGWALAALLRAYQKQVETALAGLPGGSRAFLVMSLVEQETCQSQVAIAERLGVDRTTLTYLIDDLETEKLIKRTTDPADRRNRHIGLTAKGTKTLAQLVQSVEQVERDVLSRLTKAEAEQFYASLVKSAGLEEGPSTDAESAHICRAALPGN